MDYCSCFALLLLPLLVALLFPVFRIVRRLPGVEKGTVAFFHPNADGGGGGERVLWCAVKAVQDAFPKLKIFIYVHQGPSVEQLVEDAKERFNIQLTRPFELVPLTKSDLLLPEQYTRFTLIGQAVGSVKLGHEALSKLVPEVFIDTTGWAFTYPLARLAGSRVASYVHYPTISTNMIGRVWQQESSYNNDAAISGSYFKSLAKLLYYNLFALVYGAVGACSQVTMANSSWTRRHIGRIWWGWHWLPDLVYPPCDTEQLQKLPLDRRLKRLFLVSVAQFRPEKNHRLQLEAFALTKQQAASEPATHNIRVARLKMVGSCRNEGDRQRLQKLQDYAKELGLEEHVDWHVNVSFSELQQLLGDAVGGLHTMRDEHFGISVVEYMAAGCIPIAHNSAGPKEDIVVPQATEGSEYADQITGYLACSVEEYASAIREVLLMSQVDRLKIAAAAQRHAARFSTASFINDFTASMRPILDQRQL